MASAIYQNHVKNGPNGWDAHHIASEIGYEEALRRGLLAECDFARQFSCKVNEEILLSHGDGGVDFQLDLVTSQGVRRFTVNVKAKSVQKSWDGLRQSGTHLRVPVAECKPLTIYVFAIYLEPTDDAEVLAWDWGRTLIRQNERRQFEGGAQPWNYVRLFEDLRDLEELKRRMVVPALTRNGPPR